jgi:hypothetical protein
VPLLKRLIVRQPNFTAVGLYLLISILFFGLRAVTDPATVHVGFTSDVAMMMWYLVWWPWAIAHRVNPFITHAVWPLMGYNLTWATSIPAVAIAATPLTAAFGPVVSYNIVALLAPVLSACAAFALCRHLTGKFSPSLMGGFVYGFSPYEVIHVYAGHLPLTLSFAPPLCVLLIMLFVQGRMSSTRFAVTLALLLVLQCLISTEVLATMTVIGAMALSAAFALLPGMRRRMMAVAVPIAAAYASAAMLLTPFFYYAFVAGAPPRDPIFPAAFFSANPLGFIIPGPLSLLPPRNPSLIVAHGATVWEEGAYLGLPLLAVAAAFSWSHRGDRAARLLALVLIVTAVAALGPALHLHGRAVMPLPWAVISALPLLRQALPLRLASYAFLTLALIVSLWLRDPRARFRTAAVISIVLTLLPNPGLVLYRSTFETPAFFSRGLYRRYLRRNENVLIIPFGRNGPSMAWQAESWMYFRMPGGHLSTTPEDFRRWPAANTLMTSMPLVDPAEQFKAFAVEYKIDAVLVANSAHGFERKLPKSLGIKPILLGDVSLYHLPPNLLGDPIALSVLQRAATEVWFADLLCAAHRFIAGGGNLSDLNPEQGYELGFLPESKWSDTLELLLAVSPHGASNGLWIGPGTDGAVAAGLLATPNTLAPLVSRYTRQARGVFYPYPRKYSDASDEHDGSMHLLMMTFRPEMLNSACPPHLEDSRAIK